MPSIGTSSAYVPKQISASTIIKSSDGVMDGIFVSNAASAPTITVYDGTSTSGTKVVDTFTPTSNTNYRIPIAFSTGLYVAISGTVSCTVLYI